MSNIIKGSALQRSNPKVIELAVIGRLDGPQPIKTGLEIAAEKEREHLSTLQMESQKVLQETEAMIVDLLEKAREEARSIIEAARDEAELIHIQASQAAQQIKAQAEEDGYQEGIEKARREMADLQALAQETSRACLEEARIQKLKTIKDCETDILRLTLAIANKVVAAEVKTNPEVILSVIREAIALLDNPDNITVRVNPAELERVLDCAPAVFHCGPEGELINLRVIPDNRIKEGGCTVEGDAGMVDARIETRLTNMAQLIQDGSGDD